MMIPKALLERAEALGLKVIRVKDRSALFQVVALDGEPIFRGHNSHVASWLKGAKWAGTLWRPVVDEGPDQPPLDFEAVIAWNPKEDRAYTGIFEHDGKFQTPYGRFYRRDFSHWMPMVGPKPGKSK